MTPHDHPWVVLFLQYVCIFHSGLCWLYYSFVAVQVLWWPNKLELWSVLPHVRPSIHKKYFRFRSNLVLVGLDQICGPVWLQLDPRLKIKVTELLKFRKLHFSRSLSSSILVWSSKLMVDCDSMGPSLYLSEPDFLISSQKAITWLHTLWNINITGLSEGHISILVEASHMVGCAGSPLCIVHADMTFSQSKVKVTGRWPPAPFRGLYWCICIARTSF